MQRKEITALLSDLLERDILGDSTWAREVKYSKLGIDGVGGRIDYMQFIPEVKDHYCATERSVQRGDFNVYEIKSDINDYMSGCGLNFIGDYNSLVMTMELFKYLRQQRRIPYGIGVFVPVPMYTGKQPNSYFYSELCEPSKLTDDRTAWRLHKMIAPIKSCKCFHGTAELLYAMLRAK